MSRRRWIALVVSILTALALYASERPSDESCTPDAREQVARAHRDLGKLFQTTTKIVETDHGVAAIGGPAEVMLARIDADGNVVLSCVNSESAARRFLEAPVEKLPHARAQEK